jgi:Skp family chaperone for outer membrane proteins
MRNLLILSAAAAAIAVPSASQAQALPAAVIAVVDLEKVTTECTACKAARATLQGQVTALQNREKALAAPLETEQKAIQTAIDALAGKQPDAALQARMKAWETKRQQAGQEIATQQQQIQRNSAYVSQQIATKLGPIYQQVMQRRGASVMVEMGATLATASQLDVTNDVLTALNTAMPSVSVTAPAQQQPQGR